jgi:hypothetical protein
MRLNKMAKIQSGYISRGKIEAREDGSHFLLQAKNVDGHRLTYVTDALIRFSPSLTRKDRILETGDVLFMARGARNYSLLMREIPDSVLAAACFFVVTVSSDQVLPAYLSWYLNQPPAQNYLSRYSGRGVHMPVVRRSVLENLDVPLPPLEAQKKIAELDALMRQEQQLLDKLAQKRKNLIAMACLKAVRGS